MQGVEIGYAIRAKDDSFGVNHELAVAVLQRCLNDPPIAASCNRPARLGARGRRRAPAPRDNPVRNLGTGGGDAEFDGLKHGA